MYKADFTHEERRTIEILTNAIDQLYRQRHTLRDIEGEIVQFLKPYKQRLTELEAQLKEQLEGRAFDLRVANDLRNELEAKHERLRKAVEDKDEEPWDDMVKDAQEQFGWKRKCSLLTREEFDTILQLYAAYQTKCEEVERVSKENDRLREEVQELKVWRDDMKMTQKEGP